MISSRFPEENELRMATLVACCIAGRGISNLWEHWKCVGHHGMLLSFEHKQRQVEGRVDCMRTELNDNNRATSHAKSDVGLYIQMYYWFTWLS